MNVAREAVMAALVALLEGVAFASPVNGQTGFVSVSRRLKLWSDVRSRSARAVRDRASRTAELSERGAADEDDAECRPFHLHRRQRQKHHSAAALNTMMDALEAALKPQPSDNNRQTLGGLVSHCRIDGAVLKDPAISTATACCGFR